MSKYFIGSNGNAYVVCRKPNKKMLNDGLVFARSKDFDRPRPTDYKQCTVYTTGHGVGPDCLEDVIHKSVIQYIKKKHSYVSDFICPRDW